MRCFFHFLFILFSFFSCTKQDWQKDALKVDRVASQIVHELAQVDSKDTLLERQEKLKNLFHQFTICLCDADKSRRQLGYDKVFSLSLVFLQKMQEETQRVQEIQGCKEILESMQKEGLHYLDAYDRKLQRIDPFLGFEKKAVRIRR
jgi:hypothetical protein